MIHPLLQLLILTQEEYSYIDKRNYYKHPYSIYFSQQSQKHLYLILDLIIIDEKENENMNVYLKCYSNSMKNKVPIYSVKLSVCDFGISNRLENVKSVSSFIDLLVI